MSQPPLAFEVASYRKSPTVGEFYGKLEGEIAWQITGGSFEQPQRLCQPNLSINPATRLF